MRILSAVAVAVWLTGCAMSPDATKRIQIESAFLGYIGKEIKRSPEVQVWRCADACSSAAEPVSEAHQIPAGYQRAEYVVTYDYETQCVDSYAVFEQCDQQVCSYLFERTVGICG